MPTALSPVDYGLTYDHGYATSRSLRSCMLGIGCKRQRNHFLNDLNKSPNLESVVRDLGLADRTFRIPFPGIQDMAALYQGNEILLMWEEPAKHCVRVCGCDLGSQLVTVMDPAQDELQTYDAARLNTLARSLVYFERRH